MKTREHPSPPLSPALLLLKRLSSVTDVIVSYYYYFYFFLCGCASLPIEQTSSKHRRTKRATALVKASLAAVVADFSFLVAVALFQSTDPLIPDAALRRESPIPPFFVFRLPALLYALRTRHRISLILILFICVTDTHGALHHLRRSAMKPAETASPLACKASSDAPTAMGGQPVKKSKTETEGLRPAPASRSAPNAVTRGAASVALAPEAIPTSSTLLSAPLRKAIHDIWAAERHATSLVSLSATTASTHSGSSGADDARAIPRIDAVIPPFKVGTLEMYRRFPEAYDLLMQHHNCTAVQSLLLRDIVSRITRTAAPSTSASWMHVADFGCGTGRIETIIAQHEAVHAIYAYDGEAAMLRQCLLNTVRTAAQSQHYTGVRLHPVATSVSAPVDASVSSPSLPSVELCGKGEGDARAELQLCIRPVPFQAIQGGFLATTRHPRCSLMVCAWSLSYVMRMQWGEDHWHAAVDAVLQAMLDHLDTTTSDAAVVILETLGNGSTEPTRQNTYTRRLEDHFGFTRTWVRTDYEFATRADAERMIRFFFGEKMLSKLTMDDDGVRCRLMECTGIWTLWRQKQQ
jgi:SAM-dependent methyltransferase